MAHAPYTRTTLLVVSAVANVVIAAVSGVSRVWQVGQVPRAPLEGGATQQVYFGHMLLD